MFKVIGVMRRKYRQHRLMTTKRSSLRSSSGPYQGNTITDNVPLQHNGHALQNMDKVNKVAIAWYILPIRNIVAKKRVYYFLIDMLAIKFIYKYATRVILLCPLVFLKLFIIETYLLLHHQT